MQSPNQICEIVPKEQDEFYGGCTVPSCHNKAANQLRVGGNNQLIIVGLCSDHTKQLKCSMRKLKS